MEEGTWPHSCQRGNGKESLGLEEGPGSPKFLGKRMRHTIRENGRFFVGDICSGLAMQG